MCVYGLGEENNGKEKTLDIKPYTTCKTLILTIFDVEGCGSYIKVVQARVGNLFGSF